MPFLSTGGGGGTEGGGGADCGGAGGGGGGAFELLSTPLGDPGTSITCKLPFPFSCLRFSASAFFSFSAI